MPCRLSIRLSPAGHYPLPGGKDLGGNAVHHVAKGKTVGRKGRLPPAGYLLSSRDGALFCFGRLVTRASMLARQTTERSYSALVIPVVSGAWQRL
jgi:hypothetical protein